MPLVFIEREIPDAGNMTPGDPLGAARHSHRVLETLGPSIEWVHRDVAGDKIDRVDNAPSEGLIREPADLSGLPANRITPVTAEISPSTAHSGV